MHFFAVLVHYFKLIVANLKAFVICNAKMHHKCSEKCTNLC